MAPSTQTRFSDLAFELRFDPLGEEQRPLTFPCDERGQVDLDELCDRSRCEYMYAHTLIGRKFTVPVVQPCLGA